MIISVCVLRNVHKMFRYNVFSLHLLRTTRWQLELQPIRVLVGWLSTSGSKLPNQWLVYATESRLFNLSIIWDTSFQLQVSVPVPKRHTFPFSFFVHRWYFFYSKEFRRFFFRWKIFRICYCSKTTSLHFTSQILF